MSTVVMFKLRVFSFIIFFVLLYLFQKNKNKRKEKPKDFICIFIQATTSEHPRSLLCCFSVFKRIMNNCHISRHPSLMRTTWDNPNSQISLLGFSYFYLYKNKRMNFYKLIICHLTNNNNNRKEKEQKNITTTTFVQHTKYVLM